MAFMNKLRNAARPQGLQVAKAAAPAPSREDIEKANSHYAMECFTQACNSTVPSVVNLSDGVHVIAKADRDTCVTAGGLRAYAAASALQSKNIWSGQVDLVTSGLKENITTATTTTLALAAAEFVVTPIFGVRYLSSQNDAEANIEFDIKFNTPGMDITDSGTPEFTASYELSAASGSGQRAIGANLPYNAVGLFRIQDEANVAQVAPAVLSTQAADATFTEAGIRTTVTASGGSQYYAFSADIDIVTHSAPPGTLVFELIVPGSRYYNAAIEAIIAAGRARGSLADV
jgi:hypothetical protein